MTIETLIYIYDLLKQDTKSLGNAYRSRRDYLNELRDQEADREAIKEAKEAMDAADKLHTKALRALGEFEQKEWN